MTLANIATIPNRDFVLKWKQSAMQVTDSVFTSRTEQGDFFALMLQPPNLIKDAAVLPREVVFVLDTSGSMHGPPIEESKQVARRMIDTLRPQDTLNVVTFSGDTRVLWPAPRPSTEANRAEALAFFENRPAPSGGGTEMMRAIETALASSQPPTGPGEITVDALSVTPADGREVTVRIRDTDLDSSGLTTDSVLTDGKLRFNSDGDTPLSARVENLKLPRTYLREAERHLTDEKELALTVKGRWLTENNERVLHAESAVLADAPAIKPVRIAVFLTDGYVGNDLAIIDAVRRHRGTTRVFAFGIGNSVNRFLLDGMAHAGHGAAEYVLLTDDKHDEAADAAAARLTELSRTPLLSRITAEFSPGLSVADFEPELGGIPDLFDSNPVVLLGRFTHAGEGTITLRGQTAAGVWERRVPIRLPDAPNGADATKQVVEDPAIVANLWARARIDRLLEGHLDELQNQQTPPEVKAQVVGIGESFSILSPFTSFVAVDHKRITIDGRPRLVPIPIELPDHTRWDGFFGSEPGEARAGTGGAGGAKADSAKDQGRTDAFRESEKAKFGLPVTAAPTSAASKESSDKRRGMNQYSLTAPTGGSDVGTNLHLKKGSVERTRAAIDTATAMPTPPASPSETSAEPSRKPANVEGLSKLIRDLGPGDNQPGRGLKRRSKDEADAPSSPIQPNTADAFYTNIAQQLDAAEAVGQVPLDRLAAAAGANYIVQNAQAGQLAEANRAAELFQNRYPDDALIREAASAIPTEEKQAAAAAPPSNDQAKKDASPKPAPPPTAPAAATAPEGAAAKAAPTDAPARSEPAPQDLRAVVERAEQAAERERTLVRRLDSRLYELLPSPTSNTQQRAAGRNQVSNASQNQANFARERGGRQIAQNSADLLVSVLVESLDEPTLEALKAAGLRVESKIDNARTVVGHVPLAKLVALALCPGVRRIEPVTQ